MSARPLKELSTDLLHRAAHKAAKIAMTDVQGRSGPIFKKRAAQANKFRAKGMEQEKKEKAAKVVKEESLDEISTKLALSYAKSASKSMDTAAAKGSAGHETFMKRSAGHKLALDKTNPEHKRLKAKVGTSDANAKDAAYKKAIGEEVIGEVLTKSTSAGETISDFVHSDNPKFKGKSKEERKKMALGAYYAKQNEAYAVEPLLGGDQPPRGDSDEAAEMVKTELKALANKAMHLVMQMPDSMHVEPWCQAKIAQAKAYVNDVHDYMVYGEHDKKEDEGTMDTPITLPNMSVDVNTGQNV
jgi:hypothetical protein